ncbi:MAG: lamin tail domain-containing protein, partial [Paludibacteraceae bacterium]|nr:lamin tail domain-containing protein [Paludibacteraceae bacterium]
MRFVTLLLLLCCSQAVCAGVRINEVMQSNVGGVVDDLNEFPDSWVELYNDGESAVDLDGYSVSKKKNFAKSYRLPAVQLQPHAYLLVYCDKEAVDLHTDFRLTTDKPSCLFLFRTDGTVADSVGLPAMLAPNVPYCRLPDASGVWTYCKQPTPGAANKGMGINSLVGRPLFSVAGGIKEEAFELRLELPAGAAKHAYICYTTDGSEPTSKSLRYSQ